MIHAPRFETWFRLGHAMRGAVWIALGLAALFTRRGQSPGSVIEGAQRLPLGTLALLAIALGLAGLGAFRLAEAALDLDRRGTGTAARLQRLGRGIGGLGYFLLAGLAVLVAIGGGEAMPSATTAARDLRAETGGGLVLISLALALIGAAVAQALLALTARFRSTLKPAIPAALIWFGRLGYGARAVIFLLVGWYLLRAGLAGHRVRDAGAVLSELSQHWLLFHGVALGLLLFGLYSLAESRYRRIPDDAELGRKSRAMLPDDAASAS